MVSTLSQLSAPQQTSPDRTLGQQRGTSISLSRESPTIALHFLPQGSGSASSDILLERTSSLSSATRALMLFCSCKCHPLLWHLLQSSKTFQSWFYIVPRMIHICFLSDVVTQNKLMIIWYYLPVIMVKSENKATGYFRFPAVSVAL